MRSRRCRTPICIALIDPDANSIAIIVKHVGGNLKSRFGDFLTTDGEKPTREPRRASSSSIAPQRATRSWRGGTTAGRSRSTPSTRSTPEDLTRTIHIRGEAFAVVEALNRSAAHTAYHVGQIVFLAKHFAGANWKSLSIPKGQSAQYLKGQFKSGIVPRRQS